MNFILVSNNMYSLSALYGIIWVLYCCSKQAFRYGCWNLNFNKKWNINDCVMDFFLNEDMKSILKTGPCVWRSICLCDKVGCKKWNWQNCAKWCINNVSVIWPGHWGLVAPYGVTELGHHCFTHWGCDKIDAITQTTFSSAFPLMKMTP